MYIDPHSSQLSASSRLQNKLQQLEQLSQERLEKKRVEQTRTLSVAQRRSAIDNLSHQRRMHAMESKEAQLSDHSARLRASQTKTALRLREAHMQADLAHTRATNAQAHIQMLHQERAKEATQQTDALVAMAAQRREQELRHKVEHLRAEDERKAREVAARREHLASFEESKRRTVAADVEAKQRLRISRDGEAAHIRNEQFEIRRQRAQSARERCEHYRAIQLQSNLSRLDNVEDRLASVEQKRRDEAHLRRLAREEKSANVRALTERADQHRERMNQLYLERFEEAKLLGEMTRQYQQRRV